MRSPIARIFFRFAVWLAAAACIVGTARVAEGSVMVFPIAAVVLAVAVAASVKLHDS